MNAYLQRRRLASRSRAAAIAPPIATSGATCCFRNWSGRTDRIGSAARLRGAPPFAMTGGMRTADQPIRISLIAPDGRMGQAIATAVAEDPGFAIDQDHGDVLVDFSAPAALQASLDRAVSGRRPDPGRHHRPRRASPTGGSRKRRRQIAVLRAPTPRSASPARASWSSGAAQRSGPTGTSRSPRCITATRSTRRRAPR